MILTLIIVSVWLIALVAKAHSRHHNFNLLGSFSNLVVLGCYVIMVWHIYKFSMRSSSHIEFMKERASIVQMTDKHSQIALAKDWNTRWAHRIEDYRHPVWKSHVDPRIMLVDAIGSWEIDPDVKYN